MGNKTIFSLNKILFAKTKWMCYYTPFIVCRQFLCEHIRHWEFPFFLWKTPLCLSKRLLPQRKCCEQRTVKNLFAKHGKHLLYTIRYTSLFLRFAVVCELCIAGSRCTLSCLMRHSTNGPKYLRCSYFPLPVHIKLYGQRYDPIVGFSWEVILSHYDVYGFVRRVLQVLKRIQILVIMLIPPPMRKRLTSCSFNNNSCICSGNWKWSKRWV